MTDENNVDPLVDEKPDPIEAQARSLGWRPKEEFEADEHNSGKRWRSAEDFMDRKSLFDKIEEQKNEVKTLKRGVQALAEHNAKIEQQAYQRALAELRAQRKDALADGDVVRAEEIRDQMDEVKEKAQAVRPALPQVPEVPSYVKDWQKENDWYKRDDVMTTYADGLGNKLLAEGKDPQEILRTVERKVREAFPEKFRNPNRDVAPKMESGGRRASTASNDRLTEMEEKILNTMLRAGAPITREEYIKQLRAK